MPDKDKDFIMWAMEDHDATFIGRRVDHVCNVTIKRGRNVRPLPLFLNVRNHSPDGFNWGYGGSGPAQLALALLMAVSGTSCVAEPLHQRYKWEVVAKLEDEWIIYEKDVRSWILDHFDLDSMRPICDK